MGAYRVETDTLGEVQVPADALYGAQTQRAVDNFPISGIRLPAPFIHALGLVKHAAAQRLGNAGRARGGAQAADEVARGRHDAHFPPDVFQTGSGTSTNMNVNEVIARRATQLRGAHPGEAPIHPNDEVNLGQSSNDVIPTAIHVAAWHNLCTCAGAHREKETSYARLVQTRNRLAARWRSAAGRPGHMRRGRGTPGQGQAHRR